MKLPLALLLALLPLVVPGCDRSVQQVPEVQAESKPVSYAVRGILRGINGGDSSVTVEHEEVPEYMPAMTMPFDVENMAEVQSLQVGDAISFKLIVTEKRSWIEGVSKISAADVKLPARRTSIVAAGDDFARVKEGDSVPTFTLIDQRGRSITPATFAGRPFFMTFIFTRCPVPNFCPLMSDNFLAIQRALAAQGNSPPIQFLSISFDPEFDTPEVLANYSERYRVDGERWRFATGSPEEIKNLTQSFAVYVQPEQGAISHGLVTALVDPDGKVRRIFRGNKWTVSEALDALNALNLPQASAAVESRTQ